MNYRTFTRLKQMVIFFALLMWGNSTFANCLQSDTTLNNTICAGDTFYVGAIAHTQAGSFSDTLSNVSGCDSVVTLNLTVNPAYKDTLNQNICAGDSFAFAGVWHHTAGYFTDSLTTINGCDSVVTLNLMISPVYNLAFHDTICAGDTIDFFGHVYTTSGVHRDTLSTVNGCDSIVTLNLVVRPMLSGSITGSICHGGVYNFNGRNLTVAGNYKDTVTTLLGCDSVITLALSFSSDVPNYVSASICHGENYLFHGNSLTYSGVYSDTLVSSTGCDSVVVLDLTILPVPIEPFILASGDILTSSAAPAYQWFLNDTAIIGDTTRSITAVQSGKYQVQVTGPNGCSNISSIHYQFGVGINGISANWDVKLYPNPNNGLFVIAFTDNIQRSVQITDALGSVVMSEDGVSGTKEFNLNNLAGGVYFTRIKQQNEIKTIRFVVAK